MSEPLIFVDVRSVLFAMQLVGFSRAWIARQVRCHTQTIQCFRFGLPLNVSRRPEWYRRLARAAVQYSHEGIAGAQRDLAARPELAANEAFQRRMSDLELLQWAAWELVLYPLRHQKDAAHAKAEADALLAHVEARLKEGTQPCK